MPHYYLVLHRPNGPDTQTLAEAVVTRPTPAEACETLAGALSLNMAHRDVLLLHAEGHVRVQPGDYFFDGYRSWMVKPYGTPSAYQGIGLCLN